MDIRIITDSASDLLPPYRRELTVLPMTVAFGEREYLDGVTLSHRQFFELLVETGDLPVTSQINPGRFEDVFRQAVEAGEEVVAVTLSSQLSGTFQSACLAAREFPGRVHVVDSENASLGQAILIQRALRLLDSGLSGAELAERLDREKRDIRLLALLDTLEYLKRGGRLSKSAAVVGSLLSIKPVIAIERGQVKVLGKARGSRNGNNLLKQEIQQSAGIDFARPYLLAYSGLSDELLRKYIADSRELWEVQADELPVTTIGGAIGAHVGPGAVGVAYFQRR